MTKKQLTFEDLYKNSDILLTEDGDVIHWFDMDDNDIQEKRITLYHGKTELERISIDRKIEAVPSEPSTYHILLDSTLYKVRPYNIKLSKPL